MLMSWYVHCSVLSVIRSLNASFTVLPFQLVDLPANPKWQAAHTVTGISEKRSFNGHYKTPKPAKWKTPKCWTKSTRQDLLLLGDKRSPQFTCGREVLLVDFHTITSQDRRKITFSTVPDEMCAVSVWWKRLHEQASPPARSNFANPRRQNVEKTGSFTSSWVMSDSNLLCCMQIERYHIPEGREFQRTWAAKETYDTRHSTCSPLHQKQLSFFLIVVQSSLNTNRLFVRVHRNPVWKCGNCSWKRKLLNIFWLCLSCPSLHTKLVRKESASLKHCKHSTFRF